MATVEYVPVEEMLPARALRRESQRRRIRSEYETYIRALTPGQAGKLTIDRGDKFSTIRDRLRSAARRLDVRIQLRRKGDIIYFRLKDAQVDAAPAGAAETERSAPARTRARSATAPSG